MTQPHHRTRHRTDTTSSSPPHAHHPSAPTPPSRAADWGVRMNRAAGARDAWHLQRARGNHWRKPACGCQTKLVSSSLPLRGDQGQRGHRCAYFVQWARNLSVRCVRSNAMVGWGWGRKGRWVEGGGWRRRGRRGAPGDLSSGVTGVVGGGETSPQGDRKIVSPISFCVRPC